MLNEKELLKFLDLLLTFVTTLTLSDRGAAVLLGISHKSASRWLNAARDARDGKGTPAHSVYVSFALEITNKINYMRACDAATGLYSAVAKLPRGDRLQTLRTTLANRRV